MTANILDYGAKAGKADNAQLNQSCFQKAEDELSVLKGSLYVPDGIFYTLPFYHRSFVRLSGDGNKSIIKNAVKSDVGSDKFCIYIGNYKPSDFHQARHLDIQDVKSGSSIIKLKDWINGKYFSIGKTVFIDSIDGFINSDGDFKPYAAFINRVIDVIPDGTIILEDNISVDIIGAKVAPTDIFIDGSKNHADKTYICQEPIIENIRFESLYGDWMERGGIYRGNFNNISLKTTDVFPMNGASYCVFTNIKAEFSQKVLELATYSHNTIVTGLTAKWWAGTVDPAMKPLIKMGENIRDCVFDRLAIDTGLSAVNFSNIVRFEHAFNNVISNSTFICKNVKGAGIAHEATDSGSKVIGNRVYGNLFYLGLADYYVTFEQQGNGILMNNSAYSNMWNGGFKKASALFTGNSQQNNNTFR